MLPAFELVYFGTKEQNRTFRVGKLAALSFMRLIYGVGARENYILDKTCRYH